MCWKIKCYTEALLSSLDVCSVECIALLYCTETRILQGRKEEREREKGEREKGEREGREGRERRKGESRHSAQLKL